MFGSDIFPLLRCVQHSYELSSVHFGAATKFAGHIFDHFVFDTDLVPVVAQFESQKQSIFGTHATIDRGGWQLGACIPVRYTTLCRKQWATATQPTDPISTAIAAWQPKLRVQSTAARSIADMPTDLYIHLPEPRSLLSLHLQGAEAGATEEITELHPWLSKSVVCHSHHHCNGTAVHSIGRPANLRCNQHFNDTPDHVKHSNTRHNGHQFG